METLKKIFDFVVICVFLLATIGGTSYLFCDHHALFGIANLALVAMAVPFVVKTIKELEN